MYTYVINTTELPHTPMRVGAAGFRAKRRQHMLVLEHLLPASAGGVWGSCWSTFCLILT